MPLCVHCVRCFWLWRTRLRLSERGTSIQFRQNEYMLMAERWVWSPLEVANVGGRGGQDVGSWHKSSWYNRTVGIYYIGYYFFFCDRPWSRFPSPESLQFHFFPIGIFTTSSCQNERSCCHVIGGGVCSFSWYFLTSNCPSYSGCRVHVHIFCQPTDEPTFIFHFCLAAEKVDGYFDSPFPPPTLTMIRTYVRKWYLKYSRILNYSLTH